MRVFLISLALVISTTGSVYQRQDTIDVAGICQIPRDTYVTITTAGGAGFDGFISHANEKAVVVRSGSEDVYVRCSSIDVLVTSSK